MSQVPPPIFPGPQKMVISGEIPNQAFHLDGPIGFFLVPENQVSQAITLGDEMPAGWEKDHLDKLMEVLTGQLNLEGQPSIIRMTRNRKLPADGYSIRISPAGIEIDACDGAGLYYALKSLRQIFVIYGPAIPFLEIEDFPDLGLRGVLIDIGRGKIPLIETLYELIDLLSDLKINHLQLYMEGYSFAYQKFTAFFPNETPINSEEIKLLDAYARQNFIELVPCQNCLGHMEAWLALPEFKPLAESPDGLALIPGLPPQTTTLDPLNPGSFELVRNLLDELLPLFSTGSVNLNFDEPFELGMGKNLELANSQGVGRLYLDFLNKVLAVASSHRKKAYIWGDFLFHHPELLTMIPENVTVLDWLYEGRGSFEPHATRLQELRVPFILCPGTSSWNSIAGRTSNMKENILDAAVNAHLYGATGLLVTDWGDHGHWQVPPVSFPAFAYAAAWSWNIEGNRNLDAAEFLDRFVYQDQNKVMGTFWQELGDYYHFENAYLHNMTLTFLVLSPLTNWDTREDFIPKLNLYFQLMNTLAGTYGGFSPILNADYDYEGLMTFLSAMKTRLEQHMMHCRHSKLIFREAQYTIKLIEHGANFYQLAQESSTLPVPVVKARLVALLDDLGEILDTFKQLWLMRNRFGESVNYNAMGFSILLTKYEEKLKQLSGSADSDCLVSQ